VNTVTTRPGHLPDFSLPPLDEVVVGVQFNRPPNYTSLVARDVWDLFQDQFPTVQEHPPIAPSFEMFGGSQTQLDPTFTFRNSLPSNRFWFIAAKDDHLIQFQEDRMLTNWRRRPQGQEYPRFEAIAAAFESQLRKVANYFEEGQHGSLEINQAEVSYINIFPLEGVSKANEWLDLVNLNNTAAENLNVQFSEAITDIGGRPYARLYHELVSLNNLHGDKALRFSLTFRGKPSDTSIAEALKFLLIGRETIVMRFGQLCTEKANQIWGRK
jgi:uncharacterized protein (TIGR04255 family)